jgi:hypothetical protein
MEGYFKLAVSRAQGGLYDKTVLVQTDTFTDCCVYVKVLVNGNTISGWVVRALLELPPDQRSIYEAKAKVRAEEKSVQAEKDTLEADRQAAKEAAEAEEMLRIKARCHALYKRTIDKKQADLTVRETQQITACEALDYYH